MLTGTGRVETRGGMGKRPNEKEYNDAMAGSGYDAVRSAQTPAPQRLDSRLIQAARNLVER
jgi:hypothetical protein